VVYWLTVSGKPNNDRKARRRQETSDEIVAAAWEQVREHGLAGLSMRDLGARVGMRAQSLYSYFASKHEIYDAMFARGNQELLERMVDETDTSCCSSGQSRVSSHRSVATRSRRTCTSGRSTG
jgi:AcrR family transcriptional regulator